MTSVDEQRLDRLERAVRDLTRLGVRLALVTDRFEAPEAADSTTNSIGRPQGLPQGTMDVVAATMDSAAETPVDAGVQARRAPERAA